MFEIAHLPQHIRVVAKQYPPRAAYERFIEADPSPPHHWYWDGPIKHDEAVMSFKQKIKHDLEPQLARTPQFEWRPQGEASKGLYVVARLLWVERYPALARRALRLENTCGLISCLSPEHWLDVDRPRFWYLAEGDAETWLSTIDSDFLDAKSPYRVDGIDVRTAHLRSEEMRRTVCGRRLYKGEALDVASLITCVDCIKAWFELGRALREGSAP